MQLDEFHYHEMIDRIHVIQCMIDGFLLGHPVVDEDTDLRELIDDAQTSLSVAYQRCGKIEHTKFGEGE